MVTSVRSFRERTHHVYTPATNYSGRALPVIIQLDLLYFLLLEIVDNVELNFILSLPWARRGARFQLGQELLLFIAHRGWFMVNGWNLVYKPTVIRVQHWVWLSYGYKMH